jgi:hypothetical protein
MAGTVMLQFKEGGALVKHHEDCRVQCAAQSSGEIGCVLSAAADSPKVVESLLGITFSG